MLIYFKKILLFYVTVLIMLNSSNIISCYCACNMYSIIFISFTLFYCILLTVFYVKISNNKLFYFLHGKSNFNFERRKECFGLTIYIYFFSFLLVFFFFSVWRFFAYAVRFSDIGSPSWSIDFILLDIIYIYIYFTGLHILILSYFHVYNTFVFFFGLPWFLFPTTCHSWIFFVAWFTLLRIRILLQFSFVDLTIRVPLLYSYFILSSCSNHPYRLRG